jgi:hypothetical protein
MPRCASPFGSAAPATRVAASALCAGLAAWVLCSPAHAQRNFPAHALRGELSVVQAPEVRLNGRVARLAPGARIRDSNNMLAMSGTLTGNTYTVNYTVERGGLLLDVWLLTPQEKARKPWPSTEAEARSWQFDPAGQFWIKP